MPRIPMPRPVPLFQSNSVTLRPPVPAADAREYFTMNLDPEMHTWSGIDIPGSVEEAKAELERMVSIPLLSTWLIVDNRIGRVIGRTFLCLDEREGVRVAGGGNRIARAYRDKGHEAKVWSLLFPYIFDELEADWIETTVWEGGENSPHAAEESGFEVFREETEWNEQHARDMVVRHCAFTREHWAAVQ